MHLRSWLFWLVAAIVIVVLATAFVLVRRGLSARDEPSWAEKFIARRVRALAIPARARNVNNPVSPTPSVLADLQGGSVVPGAGATKPRARPHKHRH